MHGIVIGAGEVGKALGEVLRLPVADVHHEPQEDVKRVRILHIAFPWSENFREEVDRYDEMYEPAVVVVHSTVPVGTCDSSGWVHSPVRGRHPHLAEGIRTFIKHVGALDEDLLGLAAMAFHHAGLSVEIHDRAATTEAGKLIELARLGVEVRVEKEIYAYCQKNGLEHNEVYRAFGLSYNQGFQKLHEDRFVKPVLDHMPGPDRGHCVTANTPLLGSSFFTDLVRPVSPEWWTGELS